MKDRDLAIALCILDVAISVHTEPSCQMFSAMWSAIAKAYASDVLRSFGIEPPPRAAARALRDLLEVGPS